MKDRDETQAAVVARSLVRYENIGTLATLFHKGPAGPGQHEPETQDQVAFDMSAVGDTEYNRILENEAESPIEGYPFTLFDYFVDLPQYPGSPIFFISKLQKSVTNIKHDSRASFTIQSSPKFSCKFMDTTSFTPMESGRVCLVGKVVSIIEENGPTFINVCRAEFLKIHPDSKNWIGLKDFSFYRLEVEKIYWIGGFGNIHYIGWIRSKLYTSVSEKKLPAPRIGYQPCDTADEKIRKFMPAHQNERKFTSVVFLILLLGLLAYFYIFKLT